MNLAEESVAPPQLESSAMPLQPVVSQRQRVVSSAVRRPPCRTVDTRPWHRRTAGRVQWLERPPQVEQFPAEDQEALPHLELEHLAELSQLVEHSPTEDQEVSLLHLELRDLVELSQLVLSVVLTSPTSKVPPLHLEQEILVAEPHP